MKTLEEQYKNDGVLLKLYKTRLIIPGWAGQLDDAEAVYVAEKLNADRKIWLSWRRAVRFMGMRGMRRHVSPENAKTLALALSTIALSDAGSPLIIRKRVMKQGKKVSTTAPAVSELKVEVEKQEKVKHSGGRPKLLKDFSRTTAWRRRKEMQGELSL